MLQDKALYQQNFHSAFDMDFVERLLGKRKRHALTRKTFSRLEVQKKRLRELIKPRLVWDYLPVSHIERTGLILKDDTFLKSRKMAKTLQGADKIVGFIGTIGRRIDREIDCLMSNGVASHGYIADALGSGAAENLADSFHTRVAKEVEMQNLSVSLRFSPGYCDWPVTDQKKLFSMLDHKRIGVELGDTCLMAPRKSISGVFGIFDKQDVPLNVRKQNPCHRCSKKDCIARRVEDVSPSFRSQT